MPLLTAASGSNRRWPFQNRRVAVVLSALAGVGGALGAAHSADAALVTRNVGVTLAAATLDTYALDVDGNGSTDFTFETAYVPDPVLTVGFDQIRSAFGSNNGLVIDTQTDDGFPPTSRLAAGQTVSSASLFSTPSDDADLFFTDTLDPNTGNFNGQTGFVGFRFDGTGGVHYGYVQVTVKGLTDATSPLDLTIGRVGYDDVAGTAVAAGALPEPAGLATLGIVVTACVRRRRRLSA